MVCQIGMCRVRELQGDAMAVVILIRVKREVRDISHVNEVLRLVGLIPAVLPYHPSVRAHL